MKTEEPVTAMWQAFFCQNYRIFGMSRISDNDACILLRRENVVLYLSLVGAGLAPAQMYCHPAAKRRDLCHFQNNPISHSASILPILKILKF
jgi:hypothetical protein